MLACALLALGGCAESHGARGDRAMRDAGSADDRSTSSDALIGDWRWAYVTAGLTAVHGRLLFEPAGRLRAELSATSADAGTGLETQCAEGSYAWTDAGTVQYGWTPAAGRVERESTAVLFAAEVVDRSRPSPLRASALRYWPLNAYAAVDGSGLRFARMTHERVETGAGVELERSLLAELTLSVPPATAPEGSACELDLQVTGALIANSGPKQQRTAAFGLPCLLRDRDAHTRELVIEGWLADDDAQRDKVPLYLAPAYGAQRAWSDYLESTRLAQVWEPALFDLLLHAFSPDLLLDRDQPDALFPRYLDGNAISVEVYTKVPEGTPTDAPLDCSEQ